MFCMYAVFLFGIGLDKANSGDFGITIDKTENIGACVAVSVMIQYFTLVVFMVMAAEALLMFQKLVLVFVQITVTYQVVNSFVCWGKCICVVWYYIITFNPPSSFPFSLHLSLFLSLPLSLSLSLSFSLSLSLSLSLSPHPPSPPPLCSHEFSITSGTCHHSTGH